MHPLQVNRPKPQQAPAAPHHKPRQLTRSPPMMPHKAELMSWFIVDVEADGPIPGKYSIVSFGVVMLEPTLSHTFYGQTRPITQNFLPEALAISGHTRDQHLSFHDPKEVMEQFRD